MPSRSKRNVYDVPTLEPNRTLVERVGRQAGGAEGRTRVRLERPAAQISVAVANIQARPSKAEEEQGSARPAIDRGIAAPEGDRRVPQNALFRQAPTRKGIEYRFPSLDS